MNGDRDVLLRVGQLQPLCRTAVGREQAGVGISHSWNKDGVCCPSLANRTNGSLSAGEPVSQTDADVSELITCLVMRVWLVDQVECDALIVSGDPVDGGGELAPKLCKVSRCESRIVIDDVCVF